MISVGRLSSDLENLGYSPTDEESPFDEDGYLWSDGKELVCDQTAIVIGGERATYSHSTSEKEYFKYPNSKKVRMPGGFFRPYLDSDGIYDDQ